MTVPPAMPPAQIPGSASPFDAIKRTDEDGDHWFGRELMPLLDYDKWENFAEVIEKARVAIAAAGGDPDAHASCWQEASGRTRRGNYRLTRYGAYITAMVGDVRKEAVGRALTYFAVKTREAEVARPASQLDILAAAVAEMQRIEREMQETRAEVRAVAERAEDTLATVTEIAARQDAIEGRHDWFSGLAYSRVKGWATDHPSVQRLGRRAGAIARRAGIKAVKVQHSLFGEVNQLPAWCWDQAHGELFGQAL